MTGGAVSNGPPRNLYKPLTSSMIWRYCRTECSDMRDKTQALEEQGAKLRLKIIATNSKLMCISSKRGDGVSMEREWVEEVDEFTS